jgi:hypothetical protein
VKDLSNSGHGRVWEAFGIIVLASLLAGFLSSVAAFAQSTKPEPAPTATMQPPAAESAKREAWRATMSRTPMPKKGCFTATYPNTAWEEVPCTIAPANPQLPARPEPNIVGGGYGPTDYSAQVTGLISSATGTFESGTSVTTETGTTFGNNCSNPVSKVPNVFTLQLNTQPFANNNNNVPACKGATNPNACSGWQQFVWSNSGSAYMQYSLIGYGSKCPTGWNQSGSGCWRDSNAISPPVQTIGNLPQLSLQAQANSDGTDKITVSWGDGTLYVSNQDSVLNLAQNWHAAEFNVFGDGCGSGAEFAPGTTIVIKTSVDYGSPNAPSNGGGFTGETNNLILATAWCPIGGDSPAIEFTESNVGATSICSCPAGETWMPNSAACGPLPAMCTKTGCVGSANWQYSLTCTGMDVGIVYNGGCTSPAGEPQNCYAGFNGLSTVSADWGGVAGPPTWYTPGQQGSPTVCTVGFGQQNCNTYAILGLPACPTEPPSPPPLCPNGERYCLKFSPPQCVPEKLCLVQPAQP